MPQILGIIGSSTAKKPALTGGTLYSDSTYYYRLFTANGTLGVQNQPISVDVLVIAGGGGGGRSDRAGGGGGAGGVLDANSINLSVGNQSITVGGGGAASVA